LHREYVMTMSCDTAAPTKQLSKSQLVCRHALAEPLRLHVGTKLAYMVLGKPWDNGLLSNFLFFVCHTVVAGVTNITECDINGTPGTVKQRCNSQQFTKAEGSKHNVRSRSYM